MSEPIPPEVGRWTGMGEALARLALACAGAAVGVGLLGAVVAWATGHDVAGGIAGAYYVIGCLLFLVGLFPTGGFSMIRGTITRRRPVGARQEPVFVIGLVLIALGVAVDVLL
ncbi:MAG: hypothetical protein ACJ74L_11195 [Gaiellaceae bacterium]